MKNILKSAMFLLSFACLNSCTNDKDYLASANGFELRNDSSVVPSTVFSDVNKTEIFSKLNWDRSDFGVSSVSSYVVVISDHNDSNPDNEKELPNVVSTVADSRTATFTIDVLNKAMNMLPTFSCNQMDIDIRIKSTLGVSSNAIIQYSNPIKVSVTGYSTAPLILAFVKDSDNPVNAKKIITSNYTSAADYEGYMYLEAGNYKLYKPDACGDFTTPTIYGLTAGTVVAGGTDGFVVGTAAHYLVKVNLNTFTYLISPITSFGIFGTAKGVPTGINRAMTYNIENNKWELTSELFKGRVFKFRSVNGSTPVSVLGGGAADNTVVESNSSTDIKVPGTNDGTKQNYTITLDVSNPRQYIYSLLIP